MKRTFRVGQVATIRTITEADKEHYPELSVGDKGVIEKVFQFHVALSIDGKWYGMEKFQLELEEAT